MKKIFLFIPLLLLAAVFVPTTHYLEVFDPTATLSPKEMIMEEKIIPRLSQIKDNFALFERKSFIGKADASVRPSVKAGLVFDLDTGEILYKSNSAQKLPVASLTKIMTAVVVLDLARPDEEFTVTDHAASQIPTKIGVVPGERMLVDELLKAALLTSANDSVSVIQEGVDFKFGAPIFIEAMNAKAQFLGLKHTSFANPQGFDDVDNFSTAEDLARLTHYAYTNYPLIREIVAMDYDFLKANTNHKQFDLYNWNGLIGVYPGAVGMKIGSTEDAGKTTIVIAQREGKKLAAVALGASDIFSRDLAAADLLDIGYEEALGLPPVQVDRIALQKKYNTWKY